MDGGERLYIVNATVATIEGKGNVIIKFTSEKELILLDVLHIQEIWKNLMSEPILSKKGFRLVFESAKFVLEKGGMYVRNGYFSEGLFKLNYIPKIIINENVINSSYIVESCNM